MLGLLVVGSESVKLVQCVVFPERLPRIREAASLSTVLIVGHSH